MEECRKHKLNQKAGSFAEPNPECLDFYPECPDKVPDYPELYPEYPDIHVVFTTPPPLRCRFFFKKTMNDMKTMNDICMITLRYLLTQKLQIKR